MGRDSLFEDVRPEQRRVVRERGQEHLHARRPLRDARLRVLQHRDEHLKSSTNKARNATRGGRADRRTEEEKGERREESGERREGEGEGEVRENEA